MTKNAVQALIKRESLEGTWKQITKELASGNSEILTQTGENVLKNLAQVEKVAGPEAVDTLLKRAASEVDELAGKPSPGFFQSILDQLIRDGKIYIQQGKIYVKESAGPAKGIVEELVSGSGIPLKEFSEKGTKKGVVSVLSDLTPFKTVKSQWFKLLPGGKLVGSVGKTTVNLPGWIWRHRYPVFVLLAYASLLDSEEPKEALPTTSNSIGLTVPYLFSEETKNYELNEDASQYFITNKDKPEDRLYLASPCKSDFEIVKKKCTCVSSPDNWSWNFGGGLIDVKKGSIQLKDEDDMGNAAIEETKKRTDIMYYTWKEAVPIYIQLKEKGFENILTSGKKLYEITRTEEGKKFYAEFNKIKGSSKVDIGNVLQLGILSKKTNIRGL